MTRTWRVTRRIPGNLSPACSSRSLRPRTLSSRSAILGRATIEVVALAPYSWFERWADTRWKRRGADYDALKQRLTERLRAELERHVPAVRGRIDYCELSTPLSTRNFANYHQGQIYGSAATPARFRARALSPRTRVRNLYLTGVDVAVLGVAGALAGGALTASAVLRRNVLP